MRLLNNYLPLHTAATLLLFLLGSGFLFTINLSTSPARADIIDTPPATLTPAETSPAEPETPTLTAPLPTSTDTATVEPALTETLTTTPPSHRYTDANFSPPARRRQKPSRLHRRQRSPQRPRQRIRQLSLSHP